MMFPHMIPYAEPFYFFLLAIALIPIVLSLLIWKKRLPIYQSVVTLFFL
ncbi:D-alanyl-lipoteichoic acid biosynthesis protein DltB, partial [Enterococcus faecium]|nr:D-alanyl-lipoteichoic acid biosynthesis protein DltB [Enterococcus faecium]